MRSHHLIIIALTLIVTLACASDLVDARNGVSSISFIDDGTQDAPPDILKLGDRVYEDITVYFFWAIGCSHCALVEPHIDYLEDKYPQATFLRLEVTRNSTNWALYQDLNHRLNVENQKVPSAFVGDEALIGEDAIQANLETIIVRMIQANTGPPTAPLNLQATPGDTFINLTWYAPAYNGGKVITNYEVWRGPSPNGETFLADAGTKRWYNDTGLNNDQTYYYVIKAENMEGMSPRSNEVSAIPSPLASVPTAPRNLVATAIECNVVLTWSVPSNDGGAAVTNYTVYRGTIPGEETPLITLDDVLSFTDTCCLDLGLTYYYKISAVNSIGEGARSNEASAIAGIPSVPEGLVATPGNSQVRLMWSAPSYPGPGTITYHLFRNGTEIWSGTVTEHIDRGLTNGVSYSYSLAASNSVGRGPNCSIMQTSPTEFGTSSYSVELTIGAVVVAALVDSINPCAISVMIFLLIFLTSLGDKKRVLIVGLVYIATVYAVYFMAGIGLLTFLQSTAMTRYVYYGAAAIAIVFGLLNMKDFFLKRDQPTLAISESKKPLIKKYIEKASVPGAVVLGAMVSLFELPCTGGIYLAILSLLGDTMTFSEGTPWLALYNLIFVLPLGIVLAVIFKGVSADKANEWRLQNRSYLRLMIGLVMLVLGAMMLLGVF